MSITSCYRYVLELPVVTLNSLLTAAMSESDSAGISISQHYEDVPVGSWTATVDVHPDDPATNPPSLDLPAANLTVVLHLKVRIETKINEMPELDKIIHFASFDLDGIFEKTTETPPRLVMNFPAVTSAGLNLVVTGGQIPLTPELIEPKIHEIYDSDPELGHKLTPGVPWPIPGDPTVSVITDIYDDDLGSSGFRGAISVSVPDATHIKINMPGHFKVLSLATTYIDTDMTVEVLVSVQFNDGEVRFLLSGVQQADVTVTFSASSPYDIGAKPILAGQIADKIRSFGDQTQATPTNADISALITGRLIEFAANLTIPVFTPQGSSGTDVIDLTTFEASTVNQQVLALGLEPLGDGTPCDPPDVFAAGGDGFAISVVAAKVNEYIDDLKAGINGSVRNFEGHDVTIDSVNAVLSDPGEHSQAAGHIWITGSATAEVDCWADPTVDFWGPIGLVPSLDPDGTIKVTPDAGTFDADDPCCGDVDPAQIAAVVESDQQNVATMPTNFTSVGELNLAMTTCDISRAGLVIHGTLAVTTLSALHIGQSRRLMYWFFDPPAGG